jgi:hypothetical protein
MWTGYGKADLWFTLRKKKEKKKKTDERCKAMQKITSWLCHFFFPAWDPQKLHVEPV